jgi:HAD superfamily hydrolase (TIGR01549 family)
MYQDYLSSKGLRADPWAHQVLYDVFDFYAAAYDPTESDDEKLRFWAEFTRRLFERTNVRDFDLNNINDHAQAIRDIFGPNHFDLYPEVKDVLHRLKNEGFRLGVISNWQRGLDVFLRELGILTCLDLVMTSAEVGFEKPDARFFEEAIRRMQLPPEQLLHVGDSLEDDFQGAISAGIDAVLLDRGNDVSHGEVKKVRDLRELEELLV